MRRVYTSSIWGLSEQMTRWFNHIIDGDIKESKSNTKWILSSEMTKCIDYRWTQKISSPNLFTPKSITHPEHIFIFIRNEYNFYVTKREFDFCPCPLYGPHRKENESRATFINDLQCIYFFNSFVSGMDLAAATKEMCQWWNLSNSR